LGWRHALLALAAVLAVTPVLPQALVLRRDPADLGLHPDGESARPPAGVSEQASTSGLRSTAHWTVRDPLFGWLTLAFAATTLAVIVVAIYLMPFLRVHGHSAAFAATATGALGALSVTGRLVVTGATRRWSMPTVTTVAFAAQAVAVPALIAAGSTTAGAVAFVLLFGLGFGVGTIARSALLAAAYGTHAYATVSALAGVALTAAKTIGPFSAGLVRTATDSYTPVMAALLVVCTVAAITVNRSGDLLTSSATTSRERRRPTMEDCCDDLQCCDTGCC